MPLYKINCEERGSVLVEKVKDNLYIIRVNDNHTNFFEGLWEIPEGITYNSYLLTLPERTILLDTVKSSFTDCYVEALSRIVDIRSITDIVLHHTEPDHSGALPKVLELNNKAVIHLHPIAKRFVESTYRIRLRSVKHPKDGDAIEDEEYRLVFYATPWLHWPDTVMSLLEPYGVLFSGDAFGSYSIPSSIYDDSVNWDEYIWFMKKYFVTVIGAYKGWVSKALAKLESVREKIKMIAPLHGAIIRSHVPEVFDLYEKLAKGVHASSKAVVVYASMYGSVEKAVGMVASLLRKEGFNVVMYGFTDSTRARLSDLLADVADSEIVVLGASTYEAGVMPLASCIVNMLCSKAAAGQKVILISTYGWGAAAAKLLSKTLEKCGLKPVAIIERLGSISFSDIENVLGKVFRGRA